METFINNLMYALIEAVLVSGMLGYFFLKREERIKRTIEEEFKKRDKFFDTQFNYKLKSLEELLAPVRLQFIRSKITLLGYDANNEYREKILKECNENVLNLLLEKGYLIPADLIPFAEKLIKHYDEWLQHYRKTREITKDESVKYVFTFNFPQDAEKEFIDKYDAYRKELKIEGILN